MQTWQGYITALNQQSHPAGSMPQTAPFETTSSKYANSGFLDVLVSSPQIQARYDAMQGTWEGPEASEKAVSKGMFKTEAMPIEQKQTPTKK